MKTILSPYSFIAVLCLFAVAPVNAPAQQWLANLPKKSAQELTFKDFQKAFQEYSQQHPVSVEQENVAPKQRLEKAEAIQAKIAIEEQKLFKRWEWLMEPRTYPSGRLDQAAITEIRERISEEDKQLLKNAGPSAGPMMLAGPPVQLEGSETQHPILQRGLSVPGDAGRRDSLQFGFRRFTEPTRASETGHPRHP